MPQGRADEERLTDDIIGLAGSYGRYGYRMVTGPQFGPQFIAQKLRDRIAAVGARAACIEPGCLGKTDIAKASTPVSGKNCLMISSATACGTPESRSSNGTSIPIPSGRTVRRPADRRPRKASFQWTGGRPSTDIQTGPPFKPDHRLRADHPISPARVRPARGR